MTASGGLEEFQDGGLEGKRIKKNPQFQQFILRKFCFFMCTYYSTCSFILFTLQSKESINESDMPFQNSSREHFKPFCLMKTAVDELVPTNQRKSLTKKVLQVV